MIANLLPGAVIGLILVPAITLALFKKQSLRERLRRGSKVEQGLFYVVLFVAGGTLTVGCAFLADWLNSRTPTPPTPGEIAAEIVKQLPAPPAPPQAPPPTHPSLLVQPKMAFLPIPVPSNSAGGYVMELNPAAHPGTSSWVRPLSLFAGVDEKTWPEDVPKGQEDPTPDMYFVFELTNHSDKALLDVTTVFPTFFYEPNRVPIQATRKLDGGLHLHMDTKGAKVMSGMIAITQPDRSMNKFRGFTPGQLVKSVERIVAIPAIPSGKTAHVYVVNQTKRFVAGCASPTNATGRIVGIAERVSIELIRSQASPLDALPQLVLAPSAHPWKGVPGY